MIVDEDLADHIDLNFGCPVPKVTRKGGGAALPVQARLFARDRREAAVARVRGGREPVPVTVKMRIGIDDDHLTYLDAGRIAAEEGAAAVALHARTAASTTAAPPTGSPIARLKEHVPRASRCSATATSGRAGRAARWSRRPGATASSSAAAASGGRGCSATWRPPSPDAPRRADPGLREVVAMMRRHAELLGERARRGQGHPRHPQAHRLVPQGLRGRPRAAPAARARSTRSTETRRLLAQLDLDQPWPADARRPARAPSRRKRVVLPDGWLDDPDDLDGSSPTRRRAVGLGRLTPDGRARDPDDLDGFLADISAAELSVSGG